MTFSFEGVMLMFSVIGMAISYIFIGWLSFKYCEWLEYDDDEGIIMASIFWPIGLTIILIVVTIMKGLELTVEVPRRLKNMEAEIKKIPKQSRGKKK